MAAGGVLRSTGMLLAVGGGRTLLTAMALSAPFGTPVLGVDCGRLGDLPAVELLRLAAALEDIAHGRYAVDDCRPLELAGLRAAAAIAFNAVVLAASPGERPAAVDVGRRRPARALRRRRG
jgi:NAD kinase